ncbi:MAG: hypothetical protein LBL46_01980 [Rickettsiales bacterium]|jgi:hypothetical protein|nr:hypothetical protein [Rickettsiales bacterium]
MIIKRCAFLLSLVFCGFSGIAAVTTQEAQRCLIVLNAGEGIGVVQQQISALGFAPGTSAIALADAERAYEAALRAMPREGEAVSIQGYPTFPCLHCLNKFVSSDSVLRAAYQKSLTYAIEHNLSSVSCTDCPDGKRGPYSRAQLQEKIAELDRELGPQITLRGDVESVLKNISRQCSFNDTITIPYNLVFADDRTLRKDKDSAWWAFQQIIDKYSDEYCHDRFAAFQSRLSGAVENGYLAKKAALDAAEKALAYARLADRLAKLNECVPILTEYTACRDGYVCRNASVEIVKGLELEENRSPMTYKVKIIVLGSDGSRTDGGQRDCSFGSACDLQAPNPGPDRKLGEMKINAV